MACFSKALARRCFASSVFKTPVDGLTYQFNPRTGVAQLMLTNGVKTNPLSRAILRAATELIQRDVAPDNSGVSALVITSEPGFKWFSSGNDLSEMFIRTGKTQVESRTEDEVLTLLKVCSDLCVALRHLPQPTIASVGGHAASAGLQLVSSCDLVIASSAAKFSAPGSRRGRFCHTPAVALIERLGRAKALELLLLGETWTADEAYRHGLVNRVVEPTQLEEATNAIAEKLSVDVSVAEICRGKLSFWDQCSASSLSERYRIAEKHMARAMVSADALEGTKATLERRLPNFSK